ncbi:MAG: hypothetical protein HOH59_08775, partial [Rhodospirillaceae bacterium]|nr:hypothetical protein [Rhodospirillaceae bacterium]
MRFQSRRKKFRSVLNGDRCVYPGSVFDPISARIAEDIGFEIDPANIPISKPISSAIRAE